MTSVSVIIVTYQSENLIGPVLDALIKGPEAGFEIVVIDNSSTDSTVDIVESRDIRVVPQAENLGFAAGCHAGVQAASGDTLVFLGHDTLPSSGWLAPLVEAVTDPSIGAAMATIEDAATPGMFNTSGGHLTYYGLAWLSDIGEPIPEMADSLVDVAFPSGSAMAIRRNIWDEFGGFRKSLFMYHEDSDLGWRLRMAALRVVRVTSARVTHNYDFSRTPNKMYWLERNRHILLATNYRLPTRVILSPAFLIADLGIWAIARRDGWIDEKIRARRDVLASRRQRRIERKAPDGTRRLGDAAVLKTMDRSVSSMQQIPPPRGVQMVDAFLGMYLRVVLPFVAFFDRRAGFGS